MRASTTTIGAVAAGFVALVPWQVQGHAYLMVPVSRNFWATPAFQRYDYPDLNYCPHCFQSRGPSAVRERAEELTDPDVLERYGNGEWPHLFSYVRDELLPNGNYLEPPEISVRHGICGDPEQTKGEGMNLYGQENSKYPVLDTETYNEGGIIEIKVVMSTWHWGHLEFFLCDSDDLSDPDGVVTQECFNMHPLDRAEDDGYPSPIDPDHRGRYYADPPCVADETDQTMLPGAFLGDVITAHYKLPEGLTCDRCILQMVYYTGNTCKHPGYENFDPPSWPSECAPTKADWVQTQLGFCGNEGRYPEEFWNCADIKISRRGPDDDDDEAVDDDDEESDDDDYEKLGTPSPTPGLIEVDDDEKFTPAPVEDDDEGEPTPTPVELVGEPGDPHHPAPPTPGAPSPSHSPTSPTPSCDDPAGEYEQCGGDDSYDGPTCCGEDFECTELVDCYAECRPSEPVPEDSDDEDRVGDWGQCGGMNWTGPTRCNSNSKCTEWSEWYHQCMPNTR